MEFKQRGSCEDYTEGCTEELDVLGEGKEGQRITVMRSGQGSIWRSCVISYPYLAAE